MIQNISDFKNKFAELVIGWWGCGASGDLEKDAIMFLWLRALANENEKIDALIKEKSGEGWTNKSMEIFNEISSYGILLWKELKELILRDPNVMYQDIKEQFDNFITIYSLESMISYRWGGFYCRETEIVALEKIRQYLHQEQNRNRLLIHWNSFVNDKRAKILTFGNNDVLSFIKEKIDTLYNEDVRCLFKANYSRDVVNLVFDFDNKHTTYIDVYTELLVEINNLLYFNEMNYLEKLLKVKHPSGLDRRGEGNPTKLYKVKGTDFSFLLFQNLYENQNKNNTILIFQYSIVFIGKNVINSEFPINHISLKILYELIERSECDFWVERHWKCENNWLTAIQEIIDLLTLDGWIFLCQSFESKSENIKSYSYIKSSFLIRHKNKLSYGENENDIIQLLKQSGNKNALYAVKNM